MKKTSAGDCKSTKVFCKVCSKPYSCRQSLCKHMKRHKVETELQESQVSAVRNVSDPNKELKDEISSLKEMIQQLERSLTSLVPATVNLQVNNHITYLGINSTKIRDETTSSMFRKNIVIYQDDALWRSVLYTHFNDSYPDMQSVAFYTHKGMYTALRYDVGSSPVQVDAKELVQEIMKLRKSDVEYWLRKHCANYDPQKCEDTAETFDISRVRTLLSDLTNTHIWNKHSKRVLEEAILETKRVKSNLN